MHDRPPNESESQDRRAFLGKLAVGAAGLSFAATIDPREAWATTFPSGAAAPDPEHWLDGLKGQHKQLVDAFMPNEGFPFAFVFSFYAVQPPPTTVGTVMVLRHFAMPFALNDAMWAKYKIGENIKFMDGATKAPATKNLLYKPKPGSLPIDDMAIDKLMAKGTIFGACNVALQFLSAEFAANAKVTKEAAAKEWAANLIPGIPLIPSGTWGVNRAQEKGCTYCTGGG
jgi:hypothetical protein